METIVTGYHIEVLQAIRWTFKLLLYTKKVCTKLSCVGPLIKPNYSTLMPMTEVIHMPIPYTTELTLEVSTAPIFRTSFFCQNYFLKLIYLAQNVCHMTDSQSSTPKYTISTKKQSYSTLQMSQSVSSLGSCGTVQLKGKLP